MKKVTYTKELLEKKVKDCYSLCELLRRLGLAPKGGNLRTIKDKLIEFNVDCSHFTGKAWNKNSNNPVYIKKILPTLSENSSLRSACVKEHLFRLGLKENKCELCGLTEWRGAPLVCELHHINGDTTDNRIENLIILCPNCHSQTDNSRNKNHKG